MAARLLADENISREIVRGLRAMGYELSYIAEHSASLPDRDVLVMARAESRWLLTHDRDYGELIFKEGCAPPPGVLYLRFDTLHADQAVSRIEETLRAFADTGAFLTVGRRGRVRVNLFSSASSASTAATPPPHDP